MKTIVGVIILFVILVGGIFLAIYFGGKGSSNNNDEKTKCGDKPPCQKGYTCVDGGCVETDCPTECTPAQTCINKVCVNNAPTEGTYYLKQVETDTYAMISGNKIVTTSKNSASKIRWTPCYTGATTGVFSSGDFKTTLDCSKTPFPGSSTQININCVSDPFPAMPSDSLSQTTQWSLTMSTPGQYYINTVVADRYSCYNPNTGNCWYVKSGSKQIMCDSCNTDKNGYSTLWEFVPV